MNTLAVQDYWHHWQDVSVGFALGLGFAYLFYRQAFPPLTDARAGQPLLTRLEGEQPMLLLLPTY